VATTYSADFGHSESPFSYNLLNTKYFAITAGISNNSNFLSLIDKDKFPVGPDLKNNKNEAVENKMKDIKNFPVEKVAKIKGQLAGLFTKDTVLSLNILSVVQTIFDINIILRPSQYYHVSWQAMTIARYGLFYANLKEEDKELNKDQVDNTKKMIFLVSPFLPTLTLNIPSVAFHFSTSQLFLYGTQLEYGNDTMKFFSGVLLSGIRICPKFFNNPTTNVIAAKVLDIGFAAVAAYCLKDFSFKYWKKEEKKEESK
jgi:hypothetical protein